MFGIRELKETVASLKSAQYRLSNRVSSIAERSFELARKLDNPAQYKIGDVVNGITICSLRWANPEQFKNSDGGWHYYGVKKGNDQLIEVK